jgi:hypothetical protein
LSESEISKVDEGGSSFGPVARFIGGAVVGSIAFVVVLFSRTGYALITTGGRAAIGLGVFVIFFGLVGLLCGRNDLWKVFVRMAYAVVFPLRRPPE